MQVTKIDNDSVNAIRALSIDMIHHANSGHPGLPLDAAPMMYVLFKNHLRINPQDPEWFNRDRFVLSAGHGSSMLYATLYLSGYALTLNDLKKFRQLGSKTPGHPELTTPGVDAATGPLGQGLGMAVGMAMAEKHTASLYNQKNHQIIDNQVYVLVSDGDLMEGISHESASLAGHLKLNNLVVLYDSNNVTLDANASKTLNDNVQKRFEGYGWRYLKVADGNNLSSIDAALEIADQESQRPTIIEVKTVLGFGSPLAGNHLVHGNPLDELAIEKTKKQLGWAYPAFEVPAEVFSNYRQIYTNGKQLEAKWTQDLAVYKVEYPGLYQRLMENLSAEFVPQADKLNYQEGDQEATRDTVHKLLQQYADSELELWGGSADLSSSNKTFFENDSGFEPESYQLKNIFYGVREFAEAAATNGITLYGGSRAFASTFFVFSDYMKNAMRMAALQKIPSIFAFSHDSIALGQDGPTHQPIEQLAALRAMPGMLLFRPADACETVASWEYIMQHKNSPATLALSRQALPILKGSLRLATDGVAHGAYIVSPPQSDQQTGIIMATGSEVSLAIDVQKELLDSHGVDVSVVSMPCVELFEQQSLEYKEQILPTNISHRVSMEMGSTITWGKYTGLNGINIGIDRFGESGDAGQLMKQFGFSVDQIVNKYLAKYLKQNAQV